jgi:hypothetical protein
MEETFTNEVAPCGRSGGGTHVRDDDGEGYVRDHLTFSCGCQKILEQYHDGGVRVRVLGHHGKVLVDEHSALHEA